MGDMRAFYVALMAVYGPSHQIQAPLRSSDGSALLTDKEAILQRWSEHFEGLFSDRRTVQEFSPAKIPQVDVKLELDDPPTCETIRKATMQLKVGKSPGIDGLPAEVYQQGEKQFLISSRIWSPIAWRKVLYRRTSGMQSLSLYKNKGEKSDCSNYRGITLLSTTGKFLARVLLNKLIPRIAQEIFARKPVWVQAQQRDRTHDLRAESDTGEMQRTEHGSMCSFRRPDKGL